MFCQLVYLRRCIPARIRRALNELPETLDETYARALKEIDKPNWEYAHRLFQCVAAASRPFSVEELAEFLAFDFDAGQTPAYLADWRPEDPTHTLLSTCSSLLAVVDGEPSDLSPFAIPGYSIPARTEYPVPPSPPSRYEVAPIIPPPPPWWFGGAPIIPPSPPSRYGVAPIIPPDLGPFWVNLENPPPPQVHFPLAPMDDETSISPESSYSPTLSTQSMEFSLAAQFAHFSVKEYLTSARLAEEKDTISRFHVSMTAAHTIIAQVCLGVLLHLDEDITRESLKKFPLAEYAAEHWVGHAQYENVASNVLDGMKRLFDPGKNHLSVWLRIFDPEIIGNRSYLYEHLEKYRATPLHYAAFFNMHDIATFLIVEHSQDVNARGFDSKETPLHVSVRKGHVEITRVLLQHGADREARDIVGYKPLERAVTVGHVELVHVLLEYGADANACDRRGCTLLYIASWWESPTVIPLLLKHGADVKAQNKDNETPLHQARDEEVARLLLEHGANANALDIKNRTPLHHVSERGLTGVAQVLLEHGVDANAQDKERRTPLHQAGRGDVARLLLEHGADANALDIKNRTPLHHVSGRGRTGAAHVLLEHGVDVNARDANNTTPLHLASGFESVCIAEEPLLDVVQMLLQHGSDIHARDGEDQTPFMRATAKRHHEIMQLLLEHGAEDQRVF